MTNCFEKSNRFLCPQLIARRISPIWKRRVDAADIVYDTVICISICAIIIYAFLYIRHTFMHHLWHEEMTFHLLSGPRMPPVKITTFSDRFHTCVSRSLSKIWPISTIEERLFDLSRTILILVSVGLERMLMIVLLYPQSLSLFVHAYTNIRNPP